MSISNDALNDEVEAVNSIYGSETLIVDSIEETGTAKGLLSLPEVPFTFTITFPTTYPEVPPYVLGVHHVGAQTKKGEGEAAVKILRDVLDKTYATGQVCIFSLIEDASPFLLREQEQRAEDHGTGQDTSETTRSRSATPAHDFHLKTADLTDSSVTIAPLLPSPKWFLSETLIVNKSTFVGRSLQVNNLAEAKTSISHLLSTNKKIASATHNITAWRVKQQQRETPQAPEIIIQDCDDDGETAAGGRLLHLMQLMDIWNCVVVVTRWYGGVKLGPDRFRCINAVAREALVNGDFVKDGRDGSVAKGRKGKNK